jgi:hypothetical protein
MQSVPIFATVTIVIKFIFETQYPETKNFYTISGILLILLWFVSLALDLRLGNTHFYFDGSYLVKDSIFPWEKNKIDLKRVAQYFLTKGSNLQMQLVLVHEDGKQILFLPLSSYNFKEVEDWVYNHIPKVESRLPFSKKI